MTLRGQIKRIQRLVGVKDDGIFGPVTAGAVVQSLDTGVDTPPPIDTDRVSFGTRTEGMLATLDPKAQAKFRPFIAAAQAAAAGMGFDLIAISGNRSWEEQDRIYEQGRTEPGNIVTNARGGQSNHNFGIALDFGVFRDLRYLDETEPATASAVYKAIGHIAPEYGIEWGGWWKGFKDEPHFQIATGLTMPQKRKLFKKEGTIL